jgi:hypothetical protein
LRIVDGEMKKSYFILMIQESGKRIKKMKCKAIPKVTLKYKDKGKMVPNQNTPKAKAFSTSGCSKYLEGHWKRNCPKYLGVVKTKKVLKTSTSNIFIVEVNVVTSIHD